jgi:hypothetical protein
MKEKKYEIVIARYNEQLSWLKYLPKVEDRKYSLCLSNSGEFMGTPLADKEVEIPNQGREAGHYFRYLIDNYENLPPVMVFIQAEPWWHMAIDVKPLLEIFYGTPTFKDPLCYIGGNYGGLGLPVGKRSIIEDVMKLGWKEDPIPRSTPLVIGAQFYVRKDVVLKRPKSHYENIFKAVEWSDISFGHVMEPHWGSVFDHESKK